MKGRTVLIVDDDVDQCDNLADILQEEGYETLIAHSCAAAEKCAADTSPAIALLDLKLPDGTGTSLLASLKRKHPDCICIIITGYSDLDSVIDALGEGAHQYLRKPLSPRELLRILERVKEMILLREEKLRAEEALRESEERYRLLAENIDDVIWTSGTDLRLTYVSQSVTRLLGYTPDEVLSLPLSTFLTHASFERACGEYRSMLDRAPAGDTTLHQLLALEHMRKDGSIVWTESKTTLLQDGQRNVIGLLGVTRDITARRQAEQERETMYAQLLQSQKMEAVGVLAGGVAHDFNNLLMTIQGYVDLVLLKTGEDDIAYGQLKHVHNASVKAAQLTRQLLLFSRKQPMEQSLINMNQTVEGMLKMLRRLLSEDITVTTRFEPGIWSAEADAGTIEQVIMNLVVNARDAMPQGGAITITTGNSVISEPDAALIPGARPGKFIKLSVADTGVGMDTETMSHIFEPFFSTKEARSGTGLGLSVVYGIVAQHRGWIQVESRPGEGAAFSIFIPASAAPPRPQHEAVVPLGALRGNSERILLVEDQPDVMRLCAQILSDNGYRVAAAPTAAEALAVFEKEGGDFQLVLSDVVLPDQSGIALAEELRARRPGLHVVLCSGYTDEKSQWPVIRQKNYRYLQKPFSIAALLETLQKELAQQG
jgi:PAS domain S-box-containing protein